MWNWSAGLAAAGGAVLGGIGGALLASSVHKPAATYVLVGGALGMIAGAALPIGSSTASASTGTGKLPSSTGPIPGVPTLAHKPL